MLFATTDFTKEGKGDLMNTNCLKEKNVFEQLF